MADQGKAYRSLEQRDRAHGRQNAVDSGVGAAVYRHTMNLRNFNATATAKIVIHMSFLTESRSLSHCPYLR